MELRIEDGQEIRAVEYAGDRQLTIGRSSDCDIVLNAGKVSRHHASIVPDEGKLFLVDAGSTNGTRLNNIKTERAQIDIGDIIQVGDARIIFGQPSPALAPASPSQDAEPGPLPAPAPAPIARPTRFPRRGEPKLLFLIPLLLLLPVLGFILWKEGAKDSRSGPPLPPLVKPEELKQISPVASTTSAPPPALQGAISPPEPVPALEKTSDPGEAPQVSEAPPAVPSEDRATEEAALLETARRQIKKDAAEAAEKLLQKTISGERHAEAALIANFLDPSGPSRPANERGKRSRAARSRSRVGSSRTRSAS